MEDGPSRFYLELRDARDIGGNVTFDITKDGCDKAEAMDSCTTCRQSLKPIQTSFVLDTQYIVPDTIKTLTEKLYATFNGIGTVKSIEFTGRRPLGYNSEIDLASKREARSKNVRNRRSLPQPPNYFRRRKQLRQLLGSYLPKRLMRGKELEISRSRKIFPERRQGGGNASFEMIDMVITMYELDVQSNGANGTLEEKVLAGTRAAAEMMAESEGIVVQTPIPVVPTPVDAGMILGIVLTSIGGIVWLWTCFILLTRSPANKTTIWKVTQCAMLALQISNFWMESQLFILYTSGDGLMYTPVLAITGLYL